MKFASEFIGWMMSETQIISSLVLGLALVWLVTLHWRASALLVDVEKLSESYRLLQDQVNRLQREVRGK